MAGFRLIGLFSLFFSIINAHDEINKCNHSELVWDSGKTAVAVPKHCLNLALVEEDIGDIGVVALANQLASGGSGSQVETLDLFENHIGDEGAVALAGALASHGCRLRELYLWGNHIGNKGAKALAEALETNINLEALVMWNNKISDVGADALIKLLDNNLVIKKLYLTGNDISADRIATLKQKLSHEALKDRLAKSLLGRDCIVDKFGEWSECEGRCGTTGIKSRQREVISPMVGQGKECPALQEEKECATAPCPKDPLQDFLTTCKMLDPESVASSLRDVLGANTPSDLFELDESDIQEVGLKVAQKKKLIRCICDESEDRAPCCDQLRGRHHASVDELMALTEEVRKGDVIAAVGEDCEAALGLYENALGLSKNMGAHNFYGEISYKIFLVNTRCNGMRTPAIVDIEKCGAEIEVLSDVWLVDDFRRGVANGWSTLVLNTSAVPNNGGYKDENTQLMEEYDGSGGQSTMPANLMVKQVLSGIHWSSWYRLFKTSADTCTKLTVDSEWSKLMLRYNADEAYRHSWSVECANLASLLVSSGRDLIYEWTPCGNRVGALVGDQDL